LSCPATTTTTANGVTTTTSYSCTYSGTLGTSSGCNGNNKNYINITQTAVPTVSTSQPTYKFPVRQTVTKTVTTGTVTGSTTATLGNTLSCYGSQASCSTSDYTCAEGSTCACSTPTTTTGTCPAGFRYQVLGNYAKALETATGTYSTDTATYNADEWARFMHDTGITVGTTKQYANVYSIDVYNAQPDAKQSSLLSSMARNGGGKYFAATSEAGILSALNTIFSEIQSVNSTFASAALPISATNRAQNKNEVYIGMFRPETHPRWFGNLKRYAIGKAGSFFLAGADGADAVSATTGFVTPCGVSWWTTDSAGYWFDTINDQSRIFITEATNAGTLGTAWQPAGNDDRFAKGQCGNTGTWSDKPDGPAVEKGGAAQLLRNQVSRNIYTVPQGTAGPASLSAFSTSTSGLSSDATINSNIAKFIVGQDVTGEIAVTPSTATRPSVHGDVIHSQPKPVDYGGGTGVVIFYGANDGMYHAVSGSSGQELWSFVAPESYSSLQRLMDNYPLVQSPYPTPPNETAIAANAKREFFFDGSSGLYQNSDNSKVWIYTVMRRGGRMMYGFDVTTPTAPSLKWRRGCPNQGDDAGCTDGLSGIGQTWSTPRVAAQVNGYKSGGTYQPVVIVGGGYDTCEDVDSTGAKAECTTNRTPKGKYVYVLDASSGALVATFETERSVVADVSLIDLNNDGVVDAAYAADTGGNLYRIDLGSTSSTDTSGWKITKVAYTNVTPSDSYRKFLFPPAVLAYKGYVYVGIVSGDREHPLSASYPFTTPVINRAYVYLDDISRTTATDLDGDKMLNRNSSDCNSSKVLPGGAYVGWYMNLDANGRGEQGVTSALFQAGLMTFSTNRPITSQTCPTSLGEARNYVVNLLTGAGAIGVAGLCGGNTSAVVIGGGLPPSPVTATVGDNGSEWTVVIGACKEGVNCSPIKPSDFLGSIASKRTRTYWKTNSDNK
jgi:Tfp pilus tip-associated adhesin PilY1